MIKSLTKGSFIDQVPNVEKVLALSWKQPFLSLMLPPHNKIETRIWNTEVRGWILMCASKVPYAGGQVFGITGDYQFIRINKALGRHINDDRDMILPLGNALSIGYLAETRKMTKKDEDACFVEYHPNLYCHIYKEVHAIKELPWKGVQGWSKVSPSIISQIEILE